MKYLHAFNGSLITSAREQNMPHSINHVRTGQKLLYTFAYSRCLLQRTQMPTAAVQFH